MNRTEIGEEQKNRRGNVIKQVSQRLQKIAKEGEGKGSNKPVWTSWLRGFSSSPILLLLLLLLIFLLTQTGWTFSFSAPSCAHRHRQKKRTVQTPKKWKKIRSTGGVVMAGVSRHYARIQRVPRGSKTGRSEFEDMLGICWILGVGHFVPLLHPL